MLTCVMIFQRHRGAAVPRAKSQCSSPLSTRRRGY